MEEINSFAHVLRRPGRTRRRMPAKDATVKVLLSRKKQHGKRHADLRKVESHGEHLPFAEQTDGH